jgi:hypothetical protein
MIRGRADTMIGGYSKLKRGNRESRESREKGMYRGWTQNWLTVCLVGLVG